MTDKEIIKAIEYCKNNEDNGCRGCVFYGNEKGTCIDELISNALDLINRQQAEIEYFKKEHIEVDNFARNICKERLLQGKAIADFDSLRKYVNSQIAEAIKEFAKRLKAESVYIGIDADCFICTDVGEWKTWETVGEWCEETVDNLVKEMVGEDK